MKDTGKDKAGHYYIYQEADDLDKNCNNCNNRFEQGDKVYPLEREENEDLKLICDTCMAKIMVKKEL